MNTAPTLLTLRGGRVINLTRAIDMYQRENRSVTAIAAAVGCGTEALRRHLRAAGIVLGKRGLHRLITDEYVTLSLKMRAAGTDWEDIAEKIGFSARALQRAVANHALSASIAREAALQALLNIADQQIDELRQCLAQRIAA